ncbi:3-deoxy-D-manno-octulosonic acid transferase [Terriglobus sp.]|uniref:3-deoxy-D-manno-octulosonic acid transferase n=1 Tax=Terriglobus sp. TaxID=1889013 RepID=UPI003B007E14
MILYSFALLLALALSSPVWGWRMLRQRRYRRGLRERLGGVPERVAAFVAGRPTVWVHAVSVGETLAAERLVRELEAALPGYAVVVSTTTPSGQEVARERFGADRVFLYPLDFAFAVRPCLRALRPSLLLLMESELWPRMLDECARAAVPVAVANARVSDRSLPRYRALRMLWRPLLRKLSLLLAQSEQDAARWQQIGVPADRVVVSGNLKYDIATDPDSPLSQQVRAHLTPGARVLVAGSTHESEEAAVAEAFAVVADTEHSPTVLVLAPRHPERSGAVAGLMQRVGLNAVLLSQWRGDPRPIADKAVLLVDTVGELAPLYALGAGAFVGGSLVAKGGHNPLEAAQFGVPVAMGSHFENFRAMVDAMRAQQAITIVEDGELALWFSDCLAAEADVAASGERARAFCASQRGATERTVLALVPLARGGAESGRP